MPVVNMGKTARLELIKDLNIRTVQFIQNSQPNILSFGVTVTAYLPLPSTKILV
jgi:hypothetical protein